MRTASCIAAVITIAPVVLSISLAACSGKSNGAGSSGSSGSGGNGSDGGGDGSTGSSNPDAAHCSVTTTGTAGLLIQGDVLAPTGAMMGEVLIDATGKITCAAASCSSTAGYAAATVLACPDGVISAGLINAHDHTEYNTAPPIAHGTTRWDHRNGWRTGTGGEMKLTEPKTTTDPATLAAAELRFVMSGVTSVNGSGGIGGLARNVAAYQTPTETEGLTGPTVFFDTFPLGDSNGTELTSGCAYPSIRAAGTAFEDGYYTPHIGEGINAAAENELTCLKATLVTNKTGIIHSVGVNANDVNVIATAGAKVIWSPRSNISLYGDTAPVTEMKAAGITIGMGTDWLASGSMNMLRELACADEMNQKYFANAFDDQALWEMATKNGAIALGLDSQIGTLTPGLFADIAIYNAGSNKDYRAVISAGVEDVLLVLRAGKPLYGEQTILDALTPGCEPLVVCGSNKSVCIDTPSMKLANVQTAAQASYPLFFCKTDTPTAEPTCVPYRDSYPNGSSTTDQDGDGVADTTDDCPTVFNPPREMDGTAQSDVDGDGVGDACDAFPLDKSKH